MPYQQRIGSTSLFPNRYKGDNPKAPDYKATIDVQVGNRVVTLDIAMWQRISEKAGTYFSLTAKVYGSTDTRGQDRDIPF